ncbi:hypothetical protein Bbelb_200260 [Branchiostoma belcheri]|nr:hypothetical protein Bbelb_200260 [Branchiostoma belcheri]
MYTKAKRTVNVCCEFAGYSLSDVHGSGFGEHERPLEAITYVGSIVSIIALVLTLLSFIITRKQRQSARGPHARNQRLVLINLCVALLAILITFLAGIDQTASPIGCTAVAALLHYFLLAALMWMAVEAVMIFLAAVMVFGHYVSESFVYKAAVVAWGFPLIAMVSTVGPSSLYEYKMSDYCWLAHLPMTYTFLLPAGLILMFNMTVFSIVMYKLAKREKLQKTLTGTKEEDVDKQWILRQLRRAFSIMTLFGLTWVFGFFVISGGQPAFAYLFCIFNTLQGLFVFIFHCVLREDMRKWLKKFDFKGKKKNMYVLDESKSSSAAVELMQFKRLQPGNSPDGSIEESVDSPPVRASTSDARAPYVPCGRSTCEYGLLAVEVVDQFTYLGSVISNSGEVEPDINCRVGKAASVFRRMNSIWSATTINLDTKLRLYSIVLPTAIYASETWKCTAKASRKLDAFHQRNLRRILKVRWQDHITNDEILNRVKSKPLSTIITEKRMQLAGHILRLPSRRHSKTAMTWVPHNGRRKRGRPCRNTPGAGPSKTI